MGLPNCIDGVRQNRIQFIVQYSPEYNRELRAGFRRGTFDDRTCIARHRYSWRPADAPPR
jgi:hypothetical protein